MAEFFIARGPAGWCDKLSERIDPWNELRRVCENSWGRSAVVGIRHGVIPWKGGLVDTEGWTGAWLAHDADSDRNSSFAKGRTSKGRNLEDLLRSEGVSGFYEITNPVAFVGVEHETGALHCLRDRLGFIPLQYWATDERFFLTSDSNSLLKVLENVRMRPRRLREFFTLRGETDRTDFLKNCFSVLPREHLEWRTGVGSPKSYRYWKPDTETVETRAEVGEVMDKVDERIFCRLKQLDPDNSVVALSGGADSAYLAARFCDAYPNRRVDSASMVSRELNKFDERHPIVETGQAVQVDQHLFDVSDLWAFKEPEVYRRRVADGPNMYALEYSETAFRRWVKEKLGAKNIIYGTGAEFAFRSPCRRIVQNSLHSRSDVWGLLRRGRLPIRRLGRGFAKDVLERFKMLEPLRPIFGSTSNSEPWSQSESWLEFKIGGAPVHGHTRKSQNPGDVCLEQLDTLGWEIRARGLARSMRAAGVTDVTPYFDTEVLEHAFRLPWWARYRRCAYQNLISERLPSAVTQRDYSQRMGPLVVKGLALKEHRQIASMFSQSELDRAGLMRSEDFLQAFEQYRAATLSNGPDEVTPSFALWLTVAAELWIRAVGFQ